MSFNVVLVSPLIPQNTGTIARLTAATSCHLHLIEPLGFELTDKYLKRAGLDYWPEVKLTTHLDWESFLSATGAMASRLSFYTTHAEKPYYNQKFASGDFLVFGNEERGLSPELHERYAERRFTIPMDNPRVRSLNLSNAVSIVVYEGRRQLMAE